MNLSKLNRILLQTLLLPVVALILVSGVLVWQILAAERTVARIQVVDQNIATASIITAFIVDEEAGIRGYQNTANEIFLQPYEFAVGPLQDSFAKLRDGLAAQNADLRPLDDLIATHQAWIRTIAEPMIDNVRAGKSTRDPGMNLRGKAEMDNVREIIGRISDDQKERRTVSTAHWQQQVRRTLQITVGFSLIIGLLIGAFARSRLHIVTNAFLTALNSLRDNIQATSASEQRLRATLTSIGDGVVVTDVQGRVELLNTVAESLAGVTLESALHRPVDEVFHLIDEQTRETIDTPFNLIKGLSLVSDISTHHAILLHTDATETPVDYSGSPIRDDAGNLAGIVMVFRDITIQRRTQAALLAGEKLAVAGRLAATIAHEIHNPLDAAVNLLYLMKSSTPEETAQFVDLASAELDRVTQISRAMLGMYRESRTPVALDVKAILQSVLVLLDRPMANAGITITAEMVDDAIVSGYPAELRQVFTNLLTNAADASTFGSTIEISVRQQAAGRARSAVRAGVLVTVTDHGSGIASEAMDHIFQPFFTTKGEQGTGLGLWVSQGIIQKHNGTITVDSTQNEGTTITVFLPRGDAELPTIGK